MFLFNADEKCLGGSQPIYKEGGGNPSGGYTKVKKYLPKGGKPSVANEVANNMENKEAYDND